MTKDNQNKELEKQEKQEGVPTFVTPLQPIARQVGEHVLTALGDDETVAVLTTITGSSAGQQVISIPLTTDHLKKVHEFIEEIHISDEPERVPCVGFHCFVDQ
ncbi:MAG: hypothetical protein QGF07_04645, partial [Phycisphaerales bacterium]|nr:hypothetical protein [Phycisphaerales bacterium]